MVPKRLQAAHKKLVSDEDWGKRNAKYKKELKVYVAAMQRAGVAVYEDGKRIPDDVLKQQAAAASEEAMEEVNRQLGDLFVSPAVTVL